MSRPRAELRAATPKAEDPTVNFLPVLNGLPHLPADDVEHAKRIHDVDANLGMRHWTGQTIKRMAQSLRSSMRPVEEATLVTLIGSGYCRRVRQAAK